MAYKAYPWPTRPIHGLQGLSMAYKAYPWPTRPIHGLSKKIKKIFKTVNKIAHLIVITM
jgi:hypothetical protein